MDFDPNYVPRLRLIEALPQNTNGGSVTLRDASGLTEAALTVSPGAMFALSLIDGRRTCGQIQALFQEQTGQILPDESVELILSHLSEARFLEGPAFEAYYRQLADTYVEGGVRDMCNATELGVDEHGTIFSDMLSDAPDDDVTGNIVGVIAPHLDYPRGAPCYAAAYGALRTRPTPQRIVILGTNHFGRSASVVTTANDFQTPLGTTKTDRAFIERVEAKCGHLREFELDHVCEHSIELQVVWLQHLFGADSFALAAFLCPDPCGSPTTFSDGPGAHLIEFSEALRSAMTHDGGDTLLVAGADLSHIGRAFGDDPPLDDEFTQAVAQSDKEALRILEASGPRDFVHRLTEAQNETRVCSAGCIFVLTSALSGASFKLLKYHQAIDQNTQTGVTCGAALVTESANA